MNRPAQATGKRYPWIPDFFIAGAMKCGTSSLHVILDRHPGIFIPHGELFFFDLDDMLEHPDFFPWDGREWADRDFEGRLDEYATWFERYFAQRRPDQLIGEDSTTYLASARAPARIARFNPDARIVVMLRDPASRTYSNYWHLLRYGRVFHDFEDSLRLQPGDLISRSLYKQQLEHWLTYFPRERIHIVLLEELNASPAQTIADVCRFLGVSGSVPEDALALHWNRGDTPRFPRLQMWRNRLMWRRDTRMFLPRLPGTPPAESALAHSVARLTDRIHRKINPLRGRPPPMRPATRAFLNRYFERENRGLDEIVGKDLARWWYRN
ncbi:MAG: sulfotransferase [Sinimarinibacterium sp.]